MNLYRRNISLDYTYTFVRNFNLTHAFWLLYLALKGFSLFEVGLFEAIFHISSFTMEIPTGMVADLYGRKTSRILGILLYLIYLVLLLVSTNFIIISIAFVLCGLSYTLESGAGDALVYDSFVELGEENKYRTFVSRKEILFQAANIGSGIAAGFIAVYDYDYLFLIMLGVYLLSLLIVSFMTETTVDKIHESTKYKFKHQYLDTYRYLKNEPHVVLLIVFISVFTVPTTIIYLYAANYLSGLGMIESQIGLIIGMHSAMSLVGAYYIGKAKKVEWVQRILYPAAIVLLLWMLLTNIGFAAIVLLGTLDSMIYVVFLDEINQLIPSNKRATILSVNGMLFSLLMIILFPLVGWIAEQFSFAIGFGMVAGVVSIAFLFYLLEYRRLQDATRSTEEESL